jgi:hypothetical protein
MAAAAAWLDALVAAATVGGTSGSSTTVVSICVFTAVLCLCLVAGHLLEENKWVDESITALIIVRTKAPPSLFFHSLLIHSLFFSVKSYSYSLMICTILLIYLFWQGCLIGAIIFLLTKGKHSHIMRFDEQLFFIYVLPPIIFNAGYAYFHC